MSSVDPQRRRILAATVAGGLLGPSLLRLGAASGAEARTCIDVHHHILPPEYVRLVGKERIGAPAPNGAMPDWDVASSLRAMDSAGVSSAIVSVSAPGIWFGNVRESQRLARSCNEFAAQMVRDHPTRFGVFAALPLPDAKASLAEVGHALDTLKCDGIGLMTNYGDRYLGDAAFKPLFDELNSRRAVVYVHPTSCSCDSKVLPGIPASMIEFPHSTTRTIVSLLDSDTFNRCPNIRFIFSHAGGTVPFLATRIGRVSTLINKPGWLPQLQKLYYDTASSTNSASFGALLKTVNVSQVVLGSDFPFTSAAALAGTLEDLKQLGLSAAEVRAIEGVNAQRLLPRLAGAGFGSGQGL
jgi:predicted TIM-barrel fold metal-dependent hydrolase